MAKPKHSEQATKALPIAPVNTGAVFEPGGQVGRLHEQLEQRLVALRMTPIDPQPVHQEPIEQFIESVSRISGPIALLATSAALVWGIFAI